LKSTLHTHGLSIARSVNLRSRALQFWRTELGAQLPLSGVTTTKIEGIRLREAEKRKPATVNKLIAVLRACFRGCRSKD